MILKNIPTMLHHIANGLASYIPGLYEFRSKGRQYPTSAEYCYNVWLKHLTMAAQNGLSTRPEVVAELGPGGSLGVGIAALLSGAKRYYALDVVRYANTKKSLQIFDELVPLFEQRTSLPDIPFPSNILTEELLQETLRAEKIEAIRKSILDAERNNNDNTATITYFVPWNDSSVIQEESVDMILSQAVLEHVVDLPLTYAALYRWLKSGGFMSHKIDFRSHGSAVDWNGHWSYSDFTWKLMQGKRPYMITNREPCSTHIRYIQDLKFEIICAIEDNNTSGIQRNQLAARFRHMLDNDFVTSGVFIQAIKRPGK